MAGERWVLRIGAKNLNPLYFQCRIETITSWTYKPEAALHYVSREVAELAGKYLFPLMPGTVERV
jgi:hypothetical protein